MREISCLFCFLVLSFFLGISAALAEVPVVDTEKLDSKLHSAKPPFLLDVRQPDEFEQSRIKGAVLIPLGDLPNRLDELPTDRPIVVYCRSGHRSARAVEFLQNSGFQNVESLTGGINAWADKHKCDAIKGTC